jgi:hypothetical protein
MDVGLHPGLQPSGKHQAEHAEVTDERPERMAERGWLVLLQNKMPSPREPVADGKEQQCVPRVPEKQRAYHDRHAQRRANGMQNAVARITMLLQIELKELVVRCELLRLGHGVNHLGGARRQSRTRQKVYYDGQNARSYVTIFYSYSK